MPESPSPGFAAMCYKIDNGWCRSKPNVDAMNFPDGLLPLPWLWLGHLLYWPLLWHALRGAPWPRMRQGESLHVLLGATVAVLLVWTLQAGFAQGLSLHLLGATLLTLMFGWRFAFLALSVVLLGTTANGMGGWLVFPLNGLLLVAAPVLISQGIFRFADRKLPNHFFIYIFLCAFFGAAAAMGTVGVLSTAVLQLSGVYTFEYINYNYLRYFPLLMFPEAFITGMVMTLLVVYYPRWVSTFDDARYLKNH